MSKIKYLDFAKSVDSSRENLKDILKSKGVDVAENQSLQTYVNNVTDLPDKEQEPEYIPDPYFVAFDKYFETDPLLKKNGGEYDVVSYAVILCLYDTSFITFYLSAANKAIIYTSDGQTIDAGSQTSTKNITITWDKTKDGQKTLFNIPDKIKTGQNVRWIRIYSTYNTICAPCYESNSTAKPSPLVYILQYGRNDALPFGSTSSKTVSTLNNCPYLQYMTVGASGTTYFNGYCNHCHSLEYINNLEELDENNTAADLYSLVGTKHPFRPVGYMSIAAQSQSTPIVIVGNDFRFSSIFIKKSKQLICQNNLRYVSASNPANNATLTAINLKNVINEFDLYADNLLTLTTAEDFSPTYIKLIAPKLSKEFVVQLFDNLKDLTNEQARTITISSNFFVQLTDEEKEIPIKKNWTLSFD